MTNINQYTAEKSYNNLNYESYEENIFKEEPSPKVTREFPEIMNDLVSAFYKCYLDKD